MDINSVLKGRKARYWLIGLIVVLIALFSLQQFTSARASNAAADSTVKVVSVDVAQAVEASGSLEVQPFASLTWNTNGVVDEVYVKAGDQVKAGDVLMKLKASSVSSSVLSAQADLANAQKDLDTLLVSSSADLAQAVIDLRNARQAYDRAVNYMEFLERSKTTRQTQAKMFIEDVNRGGKRYAFKTKVFKGPAPEDWMIEAENDLALKKAQLADAQRAYDRLKDGANAQDITAAQARIDATQATVDAISVIAPFNGQVLYVKSRPNDLVATDSMALNMANLDHLYIEAQIGESDIANVSVGDPITATLAAAPDTKLTGQVAAIDPLGKLDSDLVQYKVRIEMDQVAQDAFLPLSSTANVTIQVEPVTTSLAVPIIAVQNDSQGEYVLVRQGDGSTKRVDIVGGTIVGDLVTVTGDLKEGDTLTAAQNNSGLGGG